MAPLEQQLLEEIRRTRRRAIEKQQLEERAVRVGGRAGIISIGNASGTASGAPAPLPWPPPAPVVDKRRVRACRGYETCNAVTMPVVPVVQTGKSLLRPCLPSASKPVLRCRPPCRRTAAGSRLKRRAAAAAGFLRRRLRRKPATSLVFLRARPVRPCHSADSAGRGARAAAHRRRRVRRFGAG